MHGIRGLAAGVLIASLAAGTAYAAIRGPGKYCGVVVFDRWDGCCLYSGVYVMYVSEKTKEDLREYAGRSMQIDAKEVSQPINPGDGRIGKYEVLGPAEESRRSWLKTDGLRLKAMGLFEDGKTASIRIELVNEGQETVEVSSHALGMALLTGKDKGREYWGPSDGPSYALVTRQSFESRWTGKGVAGGKEYSWTIGKENALPPHFKLASAQKKEITVSFDVPPGEYDFLCGYGGGVHAAKGLASNLVAFDVDERGRSTGVKIRGR